MAESLVLRSGFAPWLRRAPTPLAVAAGISLLVAGVQPVWTAVAFVGLVAALGYVGLRSDPAPCRGRLHLSDDGCGILFTAQGSRQVLQSSSGWISRWLCVLPLRDVQAGTEFRCVICASLNRADTYRRLLRRQRGGAWRPVGEESA
jgi:hypothetical protein